MTMILSTVINKRSWPGLHAAEAARSPLLLAEEASLMEIVKLIGSDVLPDDQKLDD